MYIYIYVQLSVDISFAQIYIFRHNSEVNIIKQIKSNRGNLYKNF